MNLKKSITVLFTEKNSIYKKLGCDCYDRERDALTYRGNTANIYHPPCRLWSKMHHFSSADESEKYLALWAVNKVRSYGGVLEHPAYSSLFDMMNLPLPGESDEFGFTIEVRQFDFGHRAEKKTWLYIVGISQDHEILNYKRIPAKIKYSFSSLRNSYGKRSNKIILPKKDRSATPKRFAKFLVKIVQEINNSKRV